MGAGAASRFEGRGAMAAFATESDVRRKFQLEDPVLVPASLIEGSLNDAHTELLRYLAPAYGAGGAAGLVLGETLLAGAHLYRSLAARDAFEQRAMTLGGQRVEGGARYDALLGVAALTEASAWRILEPYLTGRAARCPLSATGSVPVVGAQ